ncbi:MAG TPA: hypothetical protein VGR57_15195 [Ktedonobacterales bacterium]|nr:hypothetical protein [Ktedonobacterales bacterium]
MYPLDWQIFSARLLAPLLIAGLALLARKDLRLAVILVSAVTVGLAAFTSLITAALQPRLPLDYLPARVFDFMLGTRAICAELAVYGAIASWVAGLLHAARERRYGWLAAIVAATLVAICCITITQQPNAFPFVYRLSEPWWLLLSFSGYLMALVTLCYALVTRPATAAMRSATPTGTITAPAADGTAG